ncbi:MAG: hypothetical protein OQK82_04650 [Candidatus Pacearchaeota archaeon]|nr:hypothetical protein [Candidatus Pacearchaeota archaeon]
MKTTIQIDNATREKLESYKIHQRETLNEVLIRILNNCMTQKEIDTESLLATIEVLQDPQAMRNIQESLYEISKGNHGTSLEDLEKELKL